MSVTGSVASSGAAIGVLGGGALTTWFDWRAVLLINAPLVAIFLITIPVFVTSAPAVRGTHASVLGAILSVVGIGSLVAGLTMGGEIGWAEPTTLTLLAVRVVVLIDPRLCGVQHEI